MLRTKFLRHALKSSNIEHHLNAIEKDGFTVIHDLLSNKELIELKKNFDNVNIEAKNILNTTPAIKREWEEAGIATESRYWKSNQNDKDCKIILQAGEGRYDLWKNFMLKPYINSRINTLMEKLLLNNYTSYSGYILSEPGSKNQYWHRDTDTLSNTDTTGKSLMHIDDFYFTTLIPLTVPINTTTGATELMIGSHKKSSEEFDDNVISVECPLGGVIVFNGKLNHRGTGNTGNESRPVLYTVYHKRWYYDRYRNGVDDED